MKKLSPYLVACALLFAGTVSAQSTDEHSSHSAAGQQFAQASTLTDGEVRKVDKDAKKITIRHGPIANLDMPGMTMVFRVQDPAMLDQVKAGETIRFVADRVNGALTVTRIEPAK
jgi:Cu(I)/Ag(I) efflux system periplasmic protein CusF